MGNISNAKIFGGIGSILMLIGGFATGILSIVGLILVFIAIKYISDEVRDKEIFNNYLFFFILNIIATITLVAILFAGIGGFTFIDAAVSGEITDFGSYFETLDTNNVLITCIVGFIIFYILSIIAALYLRKSYNSIAEKTGTDMFRTAATVYFFGAILLIIGIGILILFIAHIITIIAFFSLPDNFQQTGALGTQSGPGQPQQQQTGRVCPNCGRPIPMDAQVCPYCGKDFRPK